MDESNVVNNGVSIKKILDCNAMLKQQLECIGARVLLKKIDDQTDEGLNKEYIAFVTDVSEKLQDFIDRYSESK